MGEDEGGGEVGYWGVGGVAAEVEAYDALGWCQFCLNEEVVARKHSYAIKIAAIEIHSYKKRNSHR